VLNWTKARAQQFLPDTTATVSATFFIGVEENAVVGGAVRDCIYVEGGAVSGGLGFFNARSITSNNFNSNRKNGSGLAKDSSLALNSCSKNLAASYGISALPASMPAATSS
jgi:hypothetical protein